MASSQLSWHRCPGSTRLEFSLGCHVISRQQEAVRTRDRRRENRINDSHVYFSCDLLARSICFGRNRAVAVGLPVRECSSHFLSGRLENQDSARTRILAERLMQYRKSGLWILCGLCCWFSLCTEGAAMSNDHNRKPASL